MNMFLYIILNECHVARLCPFEPLHENLGFPTRFILKMLCSVTKTNFGYEKNKGFYRIYIGNNKIRFKMGYSVCIH